MQEPDLNISYNLNDTVYQTRYNLILVESDNTVSVTDFTTGQPYLDQTSLNITYDNSNKIIVSQPSELGANSIYVNDGAMLLIQPASSNTYSITGYGLKNYGSIIPQPSSTNGVDLNTFQQSDSIKTTSNSFLV